MNQSYTAHLPNTQNYLLIIFILFITVSNTIQQKPNISCFGKKPTNFNVCSGNGECIENEKCLCKSGFYGPQCQHFNCFQYPSWFPLVCSGRGVCSKPNTCECMYGWNVPDCSSRNQTNTPPNINSTIMGNVQKAKVSELNSNNFTINNSTIVKLPSNIEKYLEKQGISSNESINVLTTFEKSQFLSDITSVSFTRSNGSLIKVNGLEDPIEIVFSNVTHVLVNSSLSENNLNFTCVYFNEMNQSWQTDGIETMLSNIRFLENNKIQFTAHCKTNHLTRFTIIDINFQRVKPEHDKHLPDLTSNENTILIVAIVCSGVGVCLVVCITITLVICVTRLMLKRKLKKQDL